ncbi:MAG: 50S ribosomal protein L22 [Candidatus Zixiibacteriota bacterium]
MIVRATARLRFASIPARKMRLVGNTVKGLPVEQAINILNFTPRIAARHIAKTLKSAAANALSLEGTDHLRPEALTVKSIIVDEAPTAKRIRFQSMGRVFRYRKRFCHLTVELVGETDAPPVRTGAAKPKVKEDESAGEMTKTKVKASAEKSKIKSGKKEAADKKRAASEKKSKGK